MNKFTIPGNLNSSGQPMFSGIDELNDFFSKYPNKAFICEFTILEPYSEEHISWYYVKMVLPAIQKRLVEIGEIKSFSEIDILLREETKILNDKQIFDFEIWKPIKETTFEEQLIYLELVHQYCAERIDLIIQREI